MHRRCGFAISVEEEGMRCELERIWSELVAPRGLRIRFQEALSTLRNSSEFNKRDKENVGSVYKGVHSLESGDGYSSTWSLDPDSLNELKEVNCVYTLLVKCIFKFLSMHFIFSLSVFL